VSADDRIRDCACGAQRVFGGCMPEEVRRRLWLLVDRSHVATEDLRRWTPEDHAALLEVLVQVCYSANLHGLALTKEGRLLPFERVLEEERNDREAHRG
jgi:hypothetical protein